MSFRAFITWTIATAFLLMSGAAFAEEQHFKTPEDAIYGYIAAVAKQDFNAVLSTTAVERKSKNYDFLYQAKRWNAMTVSAQMPTTSPFFIDIDRAMFTVNYARQLQYLTYSLMSTNKIIEGFNVGPIKDTTIADDFVSIVQSKRLSDLSIVKIGIPYPSVINKDITQLNFVKQAKIYGADTMTERVALLSFSGLKYMIGFGILRYGDDWLIDSQTSNFAGTDPLGTAKRMTADEFERILQ